MQGRNRVRNKIDEVVQVVSVSCSALAAEVRHQSTNGDRIDAVRPQLRIEVGTRSYENDFNSYNVLAEIPGTDAMLRDEVVLVGAHLDSWHTATGATDNADGVTAVMEAMRILMAVHARPRRTIRVALWGGEEQGLLGVRAYVDQHLRDDLSRGKISVYLNDDPGTGPSYGFYMENNEPAKRIFDAGLAPLRTLRMSARYQYAPLRAYSLRRNRDGTITAGRSPARAASPRRPRRPTPAPGPDGRRPRS